MTVSTRSSAGGRSAQSQSSRSSRAVTSTKPKRKLTSPNPPDETGANRLRSGKRNVPSTDSDAEDADDELHPTVYSPPSKRRRRDLPPAGIGVPTSSDISAPLSFNAKQTKIKNSKANPDEGSADESLTNPSAVRNKRGANPQRSSSKARLKRDKGALNQGGTSADLIGVRSHVISELAVRTAPEQVDYFSSSLSELSTTEPEGSPLPLPAAALPPQALYPNDGQMLSTIPKGDDSIIVPASDPESEGPASRAGSIPLGSREGSIVPASVSGSSQVMDLSNTQDESVGEGERIASGTQPTRPTVLDLQKGLTREALGSFSMEESLPRSAMDTQTSEDVAGDDRDRLSYVTEDDEKGSALPAPPALGGAPSFSDHPSGMDTQTSKGATEDDRLSYVTDEDENEPPAQDNLRPLDAPLASDCNIFSIFGDFPGWAPRPADDGFLPPAPVMKDLDVFSQSQPYSSQGGTQRDFGSSSQMSMMSSGGLVSPPRPPSFRYPLLPGPSPGDSAQRSLPRFESPFAQSMGTARAVPNTKRNFAMGVDAIQFDDPGQVGMAFPPPLPPPYLSDPMIPGPSKNAAEGDETLPPDDQAYRQL
ncbi:hypothetical protein FRB90_006421 [Tulasnella sp. 427]|nr:hypothetical protein FRB90_006421 [Tulasnella sp. 427]